MVPVRVALGVLLVAVVAAPLVAAAPASGGLDAQGILHLAGPLVADAKSGDLVWNSTRAPDLALAGEGIHLERIGTTRTVQPTPVGDVVMGNANVDDTVDVASGRITFSTGEGQQVVALQDLGALHLTGAQADVRPVAGARLASISLTQQRDGFSCDIQQKCLATLGTYQMDGAAGTLEGALAIFVRGPAVHVVDASGSERVFGSGQTSTTTTTGAQRDDTWVLLTIQKATGSFSAAPHAAYLAAPSLQGTAASLDAATGALSVGGKAYRAHDEAVEAAGALRIALAPLAPGDFKAAGEVVYASGFHADVAGDVTRINLHEAPVFEQPVAQAVGIAALVTAAVASAAAYYWPLLSFHLAALGAPLYTRLRQPEILDNDVRNRIYDIIRANPGISARAVHRESEQSWGTVVYHLRQLERHNLVVSRTMGRTRNYYENHGKYKGMEAQLACLQAPRALTLARVILDNPGATQEQLVEKSGYPQPTTSYYVRKLRKAGLIDEAREGRYVRYLPAQDLARFVQTADPTPLGSPTPAGVNA